MDEISQPTPMLQPINCKPEDRPRMSQTVGKLASALAKAQGQMLNAIKDGQGTYGKYATLAATWDAIRKPLSDNGIAVYQRPLTIGGKPNMCTMLIHSSGEFFDDSELELKFESNGRMSAMQAMGSAVTYARRYSLQAATGIAPDDDDDGAGAGNPKTEEKKEKAAQKEKSPPQKPENIVLHFGKETKGKKIGDLSTSILENVSSWLKTELAADPKPKDHKQKAFIYSQVKAVLSTRVKKPDPGPQPVEEIPTQSVPEPENESQALPDEGDIVIKLPTCPLNGKTPKEFTEGELKSGIKWLDEQLANKNHPKAWRARIQGTRDQVASFLASVGVSV